MSIRLSKELRLEIKQTRLYETRSPVEGAMRGMKVSGSSLTWHGIFLRVGMSKRSCFSRLKKGETLMTRQFSLHFFFFFFFIIKAKAYDNIPDGRGQALAQLGTLQAFPLLSWHCFRDGPLSSEELG